MAKILLREQYRNEVMPTLKKALGIENDFAVPTVKMIKVNTGLGEALTNAKAIESMVEALELITGQKPVVTAAKKAISNFKIRKGDKIGVAVTLRGDRMWYFLERIIKIVLPRIKDFQGVSDKAFDTRGNYSIGIKEHTVFPEINPSKIDKIRGLGITIVTTARNNEEGFELLRLLGMPFKKSKNVK